MFDINPTDYRNFIYGIVSKNHLAKKGWCAFTLWDEKLILFWNNGKVNCFKNVCPHYGLPLSQGKLNKKTVQCGFHGWEFDLSNGTLLKAPYARKLPNCKLKSYKAFVKGGMVFVYPGDEEYFETAKRFIIDDVVDKQASTSIEYEAPFYLAMNSSMDYPHFAFHSLYKPVYGLYRAIFFKKNPLLTTYTPTMLEEKETHFKYKIPENNVEVTVYPFCTQYHDLLTSNKWQSFVSPMSKINSRYLHNFKSHSNVVSRTLTYTLFHTMVRYLSLPEDQVWLKTSYENAKEKGNFNFCDHDFSLKNYLRKFFIHPKNSKPLALE